MGEPFAGELSSYLGARERVSTKRQLTELASNAPSAIRMPYLPNAKVPRTAAHHVEAQVNLTALSGST